MPPSVRSLDVLAVGNALLDLTAEVDHDTIRRFDLPFGDMLLTDAGRFAAVLAAVGPPIRVSYGGTACNTAAGLASFGLAAAFVGMTADDELGRQLRRDIAAAGVACDLPGLTDGPATASCLILVTPDGCRTGVTHLGACAELSDADIDTGRIAAARIVLTEAYLLDRPRSAAAFHRALGQGRRAGCWTALTLADPTCVARHRDVLLALVADGLIDVLFANEDELRGLAGLDDVEVALRSLADAVPVIAATRGALGSLVQADGAINAVPASPAALVDTTGAGDLYAAGVLAGLLHGLPVLEAAMLGSRAAAEAVSHFTPRPLVPLASLLDHPPP